MQESMVVNQVDPSTDVPSDYMQALQHCSLAKCDPVPVYDKPMTSETALDKYLVSMRD